MASMRSATKRPWPPIRIALIAFGLIAAVLYYVERTTISALLANEPRSASISTIANSKQFTRLALTVGSGRSLNLPQLLFIIDRTQDGPKGGRVYWIDSKRYPLHYEFVRETYLSTSGLEDFNQSNYLTPNRRFVIGSVVRYPNLDRYGVELWEGDTIDTKMLSRAMTTLQASFFAPLSFKPNSTSQENIALRGRLPTISAHDAYGSRNQLVLNAGHAIGRLRIIDDATDADIGIRDIVILRSNPITLEPVAGIITTQFSTPLSHVNLLAGTWNVPNAYQRGADTKYAALNGHEVVLEAHGEDVTIREATPAEALAARKVRTAIAPQIPRADLTYSLLPSLGQQNSTDVIRTGAKAANLGEVFTRAERSPGEAGFVVPPGFSIPFHYYNAFVRANHLDTMIDGILSDPAIATNRAWRRKALANLRDAFVAAQVDPTLMRAVRNRRANVTGPGGVFVRSSTNSEDLKGFNGAGLYTSVPNVKDQAELAKAIKTVWSSVWNDRAFEARSAANIDHRGVKAAVLIQRGENSESSGVMVTANPFMPEEQGSVFINAKRGIGMRVVEGREIAEQVIYHGDMKSIQVLTRSNDDTMLNFDAKGGVRPVTIEKNRAILTDDMTRRLAHAGLLIEQWFGGVPQDIEWLTVGNRLVIVQARPYHVSKR